MAAKRRVDLSRGAESPGPDAVESVAGAGQGGGSAEVDDTSASPATPETVSVSTTTSAISGAEEQFLFITPSGERLQTIHEALVWLENEFESIMSRMTGPELGKIMAVIRNRRLRARLLCGETPVIDVACEPGVTQPEVVELLRGGWL